MIAGEHVVDRLPRVDDHDAVFRRCRKQDMVAGFNIVKPPGCGWDDYAGLGGHCEMTLGGGENDDAAEGGNYVKLVAGLPAQSADDVAVLDPPGRIYGSDAVLHRGVA